MTHWPTHSAVNILNKSMFKKGPHRDDNQDYFLGGGMTYLPTLKKHPKVFKDSTLFYSYYYCSCYYDPLQGVTI